MVVAFIPSVDTKAFLPRMVFPVALLPPPLLPTSTIRTSDPSRAPCMILSSPRRSLCQPGAEGEEEVLAARRFCLPGPQRSPGGGAVGWAGLLGCWAGLAGRLRRESPREEPRRREPLSLSPPAERSAGRDGRRSLLRCPALSGQTSPRRAQPGGSFSPPHGEPLGGGPERSRRGRRGPSWGAPSELSGGRVLSGRPPWRSRREGAEEQSRREPRPFGATPGGAARRSPLAGWLPPPATESSPSSYATGAPAPFPLAEAAEPRGKRGSSGLVAATVPGRSSSAEAMAYQTISGTSWGATSGNSHEVRIVLVGKSGGGRSATGNTILGQEAFESMLGMKATTLTCQSGRGSWEGQALLVVDTADIFNSQPCCEYSLREILRCLDLSRPGPHALVFVTQVGRFTAEDEAAAERVLEVFGPKAARHMLVLFTRREDLGGEPLWDYINGSNNKAIQALIQKCGDRVCAFNNRADREGQVSVLMGIVGGIIRENGRHYVNELYLEPGLTTAKLQSFMARKRRARVWDTRRFFYVGVAVLLVVLVAILIYLISRF